LSFDGLHYSVRYEADNDEEELSEYEFDSLDLVAECSSSCKRKRLDKEESQEPKYAVGTRFLKVSFVNSSCALLLRLG